MVGGGGDDFRLDAAADGAGVGHFAVGGVAGSHSDHAVIPDVIGGFAHGEGLAALLAADTALIVGGRAGAGGGAGQILVGNHLLVKHVVGGGGNCFRSRRAADGAGVGHHAVGGVAGSLGHHTGIPDVIGGLTRGEGLVACRAADAAVEIGGGAGAVGRAGQVLIGNHLLVKHMVGGGGNCFRSRRAADGAGVGHHAVGGVAGSLSHHTGIPDVLYVLRLGRLGLNGGRLGGREFRGSLRGGVGSLGDEGIGDGAAVAPHLVVGILGAGVGGGVHADKARAGAAQQPAVALHHFQLRADVSGDLRAGPTVIHQGGEAELAAGIADNAARIHIAA